MNNLAKPEVTIITPYFKSGSTICHTINSVLAQTFHNWEMLIIDDHSNDDIEQRLEQLTASDSRIKLLKNTEPKGAAGARNTGINEAKGQYLAFLDSDDIWMPEKLAEQLAYMKEKNVDFSFGNYLSFQNVNQNGEPIVIGTFDAPEKVTFEDLCKTCSIGCLTVMLDRHRMSDLRLPYIFKEDYGFWLSLTKTGIVAKNYGGNHAYYRVNTSSLSSNKFKEIMRQYKVLRSVAELSISRTLFSLAYYIYFGLKKHKSYRSSND